MADELGALAPKLTAAWQRAAVCGGSAPAPKALQLQWTAALCIVRSIVDVADSVHAAAAAMVALSLARCVTLLLAGGRVELAGVAAGHLLMIAPQVALSLHLQMELPATVLRLLSVRA